jgi:hypothetical protein
MCLSATTISNADGEELTLGTVKHDQDVVVFARILNLVETDESPLGARPARQPPLGLLHLALATSLVDGQREFGIHKLQAVLSALVGFLKYVHGTQPEVHGVGVRKVFEECEELDDVVLLDDLDADRVGCPLFVDGHNHAAT